MRPALILNSYRRLTPELKRQLSRFIVTGFTALFVDIAVYAVLLNPAGVFYSKVISFSVATVVTYILNKRWTFGQRDFSFKTAVIFILFYIVSANLNGAINKGVVVFTGSKVFAFLCANGICMVTNFLGLKYIVFRAARSA